MQTHPVEEKTYALLRYFELFDHVLKGGEVAALLPGSPGETQKALAALLRSGRVEETAGFLHLPGKAWCAAFREKAEKRFWENAGRIRRVGWILSHIPFVRGVFLIGGAAKGVLEAGEDFDFLVVTAPGRLWLCKTLITLWRKLVSGNYRRANFKYYCCNYMLDELSLPLSERNEFVALELAFCRPVFNLPQLEGFQGANDWFKDHFRPQPVIAELLVGRRWGWVQRLGEMGLNLVWNPGWERRLLVRYYRHWRTNGTVATREEFEKRAGEHLVKGDPGERQKFLLDQFRHPEHPGLRSRLNTRWQLQRASGGGGRGEEPWDLVLTHAYFLNRTRLEKKIMKPYLPLGPLSLAAYLRAQGFSLHFLDTTFLPGPEVFSRWLVRTHVPLVGIYVLETTRPHALKMIAACRLAGVLVMVGGPDPSNEPDFYLEHGAHLVVVGEGEETVRSLLQELRSPSRDLAEIPGLRLPGRPPAPARPLLPNLKSLPAPARDLVDLTPYFSVWRQHHQHASLLITGSRGCPYACTWCSKPVFGNVYRPREPGAVVTEMAELKRRYGVERLWFTDDIFGLIPGWLEAFHDEVLRQQPSVPFECLSRVDLIDAQSVHLLKESGCFRVWFGAESGSQRIINRMRKGFRVEQIRTAAELARGAGLEVGLFILLGYPTESAADIEATRRVLRESRPDHVGVSVVYPFRGTPLFAEVAARLRPHAQAMHLENENRMVFKNTYPAWFYDLVRRLLIKEAALSRTPRLPWLPALKYKLLRLGYEETVRWLKPKK